MPSPDIYLTLCPGAPAAGPAPPAILDRAACLALLRRPCGSYRRPVGRIGLSVNALPVIVPLPFVLARFGTDAEVIVLPGGPDAAIAGAMHRNVVAFEVDGAQGADSGGWSVLVQGSSRVLDDPDEIAWAARLPLPAAPAHGPVSFVAVALDVVTGRRS